MMNEVVDIALREREGIAAHRLFADGAIGQMLGGLLDTIEDDGSFAEMNVFIAYVRRAIPPRFPAAKRPANQSWIRAGVAHGHGRIVPIHRKFIVHQKIRGGGIADLLETLRCERLFDGRLHAPSNDFVVGIGVAPRGLSMLIMPDVVARNNG